MPIPQDDEALIENMGPFPPESYIWPMAATGFHDHVLHETLSALRGRRKRWQAMRAAALVLVFALGVAAGRVSSGVAETEQQTSHVSATIEAEIPEGDDPALLEIRAEHPPTGNAAQLFLRAGDLFLLERMDIRAAMRCYGRYLRLAPEDRAPDLDDTWLLASLKRTF